MAADRKIFGMDRPGPDQPLAARLRWLVKAVNGPGEAARLMATARSTLNGWLDGSKDDKVTLVAALQLAQAAGVSLDWVATGRESTAEEPYRLNILGKKTRGALALTEPPPPATVLVPVLDVAAAAGPGKENGTPEITGHLAFPADFLRRAGVAGGAAHVLTAQGESMWPTIRDGALVLVDRARHRPRHDNIYVLVDDGDVRLKRFVRRADGPWLISDNPDKSRYPDEALSPGDLDRITIEGRVCWTETRL